MRSMKDQDILERNGWSVDCESPFEISHEDGSTATGQAAYIVIGYLKQNKSEDEDEEAEPLEDNEDEENYWDEDEDDE